MPEIIQKDGADVEVFTKEEVEAQTKAASEAAVKAAVATKEAELAKVTEDLKKLGEKDHNFSALRAQKEELENKIAEITKTQDTKFKEIESKITNSTLEKMIKDKATGDPEMEKKIRHHYSRLSDPADSPEAIEKKLADATLLATGGVNPGGRAFSAAGGIPRVVVNAKPMSPELVEAGKKFGISDEDIKKFDKHGK